MSKAGLFLINRIVNSAIRTLILPFLHVPILHTFQGILFKGHSPSGNIHLPRSCSSTESGNKDGFPPVQYARNCFSGAFLPLIGLVKQIPSSICTKTDSIPLGSK